MAASKSSDANTAQQPSPARKHVGDLIRNFRSRAGLTRQDVGDRLLISESLAGAYERGERIPTSSFLKDADAVLDARGALKSCIPLMDDEKYPRTFVGWVRLEKIASSISAYENMFFPGLLQTEEYIQALYEERVPQFSEAEIQKHVEARLERQAVLSRDPLPIVAYVIEESVLQRPIGGKTVLRNQLLHVLKCMQTMHHLMVQVMPTERTAHAGLNGPIALLSTPDGRNWAYEDGQGGGTLISKPQQVNQMIDRFGMLRAQALTPWESAELIERMADRL
ncbi:Scr1 family TA system antitoxin-like transcriptional regulator [Streptomyces sp. NBC_01089]|uniref:helix-turn-helix domain-containing protein n=1 Tax=Streptomyces sp. NBC_01089 TaxID=2903747 RepID=UPI0038691E09|nr:helix-turn-helix transcriptional regulator [Streptomyces sp. NBC_01089]